MGQLEVTIRIGLAHTLLAMHAPQSPLVSTFPDTGNTVYLDPPDHMPLSKYQKNLGALDVMTLRVRREATEEEAQSATYAEFERLKILSDAARVFWLFFETVRESDYRETGMQAGYPVARAEKIQNNALVRTCELAWSYDGIFIHSIPPLSPHPAIQITERAWNEAARKLSAHEEISPHVSFALDAVYFAESDPIRAIIMAHAAWENALRSYLANVKPTGKILHARFPDLYRLMEAARGGDLFYEYSGTGSDKRWDRERECVGQLPALRNELLHTGKTAIPQGAAMDTVLAVFDAIEWLFCSVATP